MRLFFALFICKSIRFALRLLGRGGTALPGKAALFIYPDILEKLSRNVSVTLVTGTNGKTTCSRMIEDIYKSAEIPCFSNRSGSNLEQGISADFIENARLSGKPKLPFAVIECDEAAFRVITPKLKPHTVVVTNLFRDQLDRFGEITHTLSKIREGLEGASDAILCLNGDCSLTSSLGRELPNKALYYSVAYEGYAAAVSDAPRCIFCGAPYEYRRHSFAHLGDFYCPDCNYESPMPDILVDGDIKLNEAMSEIKVISEGTEYTGSVALPALYNVYNAAAAICAARSMDVSVGTSLSSLSEVRSGFGRMERFSLFDVQTMLILVKNPAGCDRALEYVSSIFGDRLAVIMLNDNFADGTDVSWIYDSEFERLADCETLPQIAVGGTRAEDMLLRLKYAGIDEKSVRTLKDTEELVALIRELNLPTYILPTYTAMLPLRMQLGKLCGMPDFWE